VSDPKQAVSKDKLTGTPRRETPEGREQETSLDTQETACRAYAVAHGYAIDEAHVYREVHTGVELWERPQLSRLRDAVRRRDVDVVLV
jgi:site-specific DNA recombinase